MKDLAVSSGAARFRRGANRPTRPGGGLEAAGRLGKSPGVLVVTLECIRDATGHVVRTPAYATSPAPAASGGSSPRASSPRRFKLRGAFSKLLCLPAGCPGVVAHSSSNHAQAVARAARVLGLHATVVMPADAPPRKLAATRADGAELVLVGPDSDERADRARSIAASGGSYRWSASTTCSSRPSRAPPVSWDAGPLIASMRRSAAAG